jgi:hypothetical protein
MCLWEILIVSAWEALSYLTADVARHLRAVGHGASIRALLAGTELPRNMQGLRLGEVGRPSFDQPAGWRLVLMSPGSVTIALGS